MPIFSFSRRPAGLQWRWLPPLERELKRRFHLSGHISVALVSRSVIRRLNARYRGRDIATDVLSFSLKTPRTKLPKGSDWGELIICWPILKAQAAAHGQSLADELQLLLIHGTLHLLGHDHQRPLERRRFDRLERQVIDRLTVV